MEVIINYWAVLVAAISNMVLGSLWYGPLFGKQWIALMGFKPEGIDQKAATQGMWKSYLLAFIGSLLMAFVLDHSIIFASYYTQMSGLGAGLMGGFWNWLGFIAPITLGTVLWEGKSWKLWLLLNSYYLLSALIMGAILVSWI